MAIIDINCPLVKYKDVYSLTNFEDVDVEFKLFKIECDDNVLVQQGIITTEETQVLHLKSVDGKYALTRTSENGEAATVIIYFYNNLLLNFIESLTKVLCNCKSCIDCGECKECDDSLIALDMALSYYNLNAPYQYKDNVENFFTAYNCILDSKVGCYSNTTLIRGEGDVEEITNFLLSVYYTSFYNEDILEAQDIEEENYIKKKYNSVKILKCIRNTSIVFELEPNDQQIYYWQENVYETNMSDILSQIENPNYFQYKSSDSELRFKTGKDIKYTSIGVVAFSIMDTEAGDTYKIYDILGNDVTDGFTTSYITSIKATLFVSINRYSHGIMNFKINKL